MVGGDAGTLGIDIGCRLVGEAALVLAVSRQLVVGSQKRNQTVEFLFQLCCAAIILSMWCILGGREVKAQTRRERKGSGPSRDSARGSDICLTGQNMAAPVRITREPKPEVPRAIRDSASTGGQNQTSPPAGLGGCRPVMKVNLRWLASSLLPRSVNLGRAAFLKPVTPERVTGY